jgi:hypothetical protein
MSADIDKVSLQRHSDISLTSSQAIVFAMPNSKLARALSFVAAAPEDFRAFDSLSIETDAHVYCSGRFTQGSGLNLHHDLMEWGGSFPSCQFAYIFAPMLPGA